MKQIEERMKEVYEEVKQYSPYPEKVKVIAVSKYLNAEEMLPYLESGILTLGENKAQIIQEKYEILSSYPFSKSLEWHFIGNLQKNKVKYIVDKVAMIHSVNKLSLAEEINKKMGNLHRKMPVLMEVNVSGEESKEGYDVLEAEQDIPELLKLENICICGLMTMAPFTEDTEEQRKVFRKLRILKEEWNKKYFQDKLTELSMGMSNDYKIALQEGSTIIRLGRKIFY
ncbi:MAG TPA: YggS family pyridoxal phosphate-dependent enzyme [Fusobacterium sp.]|uniref:YggS family pyridoxal phosphate-dependent enzyme n=1 Tax=Fusobacterium sp. TaxID=68766 RepID=UPI002F41B2C3